MPKLRNMLGENGRIEIPVPGDDPLVVEYRRGILTPRMQARMALFQDVTAGESARAAAALDFFCDVYARLIAAWNLTDDAGELIGTDAESIRDVPIDALTLVAREIGRATAPDPLNGNGSSDGSTPKAVSAPTPFPTTTA